MMNGRGSESRDGGLVRPLDPFGDLEEVVDLIDTAFGERLDPSGRVTLARMRRFARSGLLVQWAWALLGGATVAPGLVWVEDSRVVGNVSVRRARGSAGYLIGNVVVHPEYRRRGIATCLMRRAIDGISRRGAPWVGLEVRADNEAALGLYEELKFREVGRTYHYVLVGGAAEPRRPASHRRIRRGRAGDADALVRLMKAAVPADHRPLLEVQETDYRPGWLQRVSHWLRGEDEVWWVVEDDRPAKDDLRGAVRAVRRQGAHPDQLEILVRPESRAGFEIGLVRRGLSSLRGSPGKLVESSLPRARDALIAALEEEGFRRLRVLIQMKRRLGRRIRLDA